MANYLEIKEGDFTQVKLGNGELEMLDDLYQAVTKADQWSYLRRSDVPGTKGCPHCEGNKDCSGKITSKFKCFCTGKCHVCDGAGELNNGYGLDTDEFKEIYKHMKYDGHSGSSYAWTMSAIQYIAQNGWHTYVALKGVKQPFATSAQNDLTAFANAMQRDPGMREQIPDIDEQVAGIHQYVKAVEDAQKDPSTWKKSAGFPYPCSCHRAQGKEGWCGVAGFGVPACDH